MTLQQNLDWKHEAHPSILSAFVLTNIVPSEEITANKDKHVLTSNARSGIHRKQTGGRVRIFLDLAISLMIFHHGGSMRGEMVDK